MVEAEGDVRDDILDYLRVCLEVDKLPKIESVLICENCGRVSASGKIKISLERNFHGQLINLN